MKASLANGQVASSAASILAGTTIGGNGGRCSCLFTNVGGASETLVVTVQREGGTARRVARYVLAANETAYLVGFALSPNDTLLATTTNASSVDYDIQNGAGDSLQIYSLDANGSIKSGAAAIGSGNLTITGDLTVSGGDIDAGASGAAGTVDVFPSTASKGKVSLTAADSAGDTTTTLVNASQAGARTYTIPDAGASASFVMTAGAQTLAGVKTFTSVPVVDPATGTAGGIDMASTTDATGTFRLVAADSAGNTVTTITHASQSGARTYTIPDAGQTTAQFHMNEGAVVFNESSADVDMRVESNANANFIYVDASEVLNGCLSIGAVAPTNPQATVALLPPANATGVTANQSYFHAQILPGGATTVPAGTAPVVASMNIHEPNITATGTVTDAATVRIVDAPTEGTNNHALWVDAGSVRFDGAEFIGGNPGAATTLHKLLVKKTGIADNTATDVLTVTVPNANHAAAVRLFFMSSNGSTDAFESTRCASGLVVLSRTTGANVVAAAATIDDAQIATVAAGATHTLAYAVSSITGAVGASNSFTIQVTIDDSGNLGSNQVVVYAELINSEATGVTIAAS